MAVLSSMMKGMIQALPKEEREDLMLEMMPDMMKQADLVKMMPNMAKELGGLVTLSALIGFLVRLLKDDEVKDALKDALGRLKENMPAIAEMHRAMMPVMASSIMPKMMGFMHPMMPDMKDIMPQVMDGTMIPMLRENPEMKEHMLGMMQTMFPHCAANMFPLIEPEDREAFIKRLIATMARSAAIEMDDAERRRFLQEATRDFEQVLIEGPSIESYTHNEE